MVVANKQSHTITNSTTGAQSTVHLSLATSADMTDFISIPGSQPSFNWNTQGPFGAQFNPYHLFPGATALPTPLVMQLCNIPHLTAAEAAAFNNYHETGLAIATPPVVSTIKLDKGILIQMGITAGQ